MYIRTSGYMIAWSRHLSFLRPVKTQRSLLPRFFSSAMASSPRLQPQKRILAEDSENLSKKPRLVEDSTLQAESSPVPPSLEASPREDANNNPITGVPVVDMRIAVDAEEDLMQTEKVNQPSSLELGENQSKGKKKKKIRPPRVGRRSRNEEDEERKGTLLSPMSEMEPKALRLPKRQCALLLGFCGSGYRGMQMYVRLKSVSYFPKLIIIFFPPVNRAQFPSPLKMSYSMRLSRLARCHKTTLIIPLKCVWSYKTAFLI